MSIWDAVTPLAGVALGWGLTQASTWLGTRQADRRTIKEALYTLLELHHVLTGILRQQALLPKLATLLRKQAQKPPLPEYETAVDEMLGKMLREAAMPLMGQRLTDLRADYAAALSKLAAVDPVSAFRLRGQQDVLAHLPQLFDSWRQAVAAHMGTVTIAWPEVVAYYQQQLEPQQVTETRDLVRDVLQQLANQLDRRTRQQVASALAQPPPNEQQLLADAERQMQQALVALAHLLPQPTKQGS